MKEINWNKVFVILVILLFIGVMVGIALGNIFGLDILRKVS